jgi:hypothetical protein
VRDVRVPIGGLKFRHLDYWSRPGSAEPWLRALRRAVNLRGLGETTLWDGQADAPEVFAEQLGPTIAQPPPTPRRRTRP